MTFIGCWTTWAVLAAFEVMPHLSSAACPTTEWVDPDTPVEVCEGQTDRDGTTMELVFSDEFNIDGRTFVDGHDPVWTAVTGFPQSNNQVNATWTLRCMLPLPMAC